MNLEFELGVLLSKKQYWYKLPNFKRNCKVADYANPNYALVTKRFMKHAHEEMLKVLPYTVNESKAVKKLIDVEGGWCDFRYSRISLNYKKRKERCEWE